MILIGENIHVISPTVREALTERNSEFVAQLIEMQAQVDFIDLNVGPAKNKLENILVWLAKLVQEKSDCGISFDSSNLEEIEKGLKAFDGKNFINSTSNDEPKLSDCIDLALEHDSNLIALTMSKETGIPKDSDGRAQMAFQIYEKCMEKGFDSEKLYFDPLILPVCVDQSQASEALATIQIIKQSFDPPVKTLVGLSNISNGCPKDLRPLINRVFAVLAFGSGLDGAIIDAKDLELISILKMLETNSPKSDTDKLYVSLADMMREFADINDVDYDVNCLQQREIIKTARILLGKEIYSHSFTQI